MREPCNLPTFLTEINLKQVSSSTLQQVRLPIQTGDYSIIFECILNYSIKVKSSFSKSLSTIFKKLFRQVAQPWDTMYNLIFRCLYYHCQQVSKYSNLTKLWPPFRMTCTCPCAPVQTDHRLSITFIPHNSPSLKYVYHPLVTAKLN